MSDKNTSTLQSVIDSATGAAQSAFGTLTGSNADKARGENKKADAAAKDDLSHATVKAGPVTATGSGVATDDPKRTQGSWDQTVGSGKEMMGNLVGAEGLKQEGIRQNQEGKGQEAEGQLKDLGGGIKDRIGGTVTGAVAGATGDREAQLRAQKQHDTGKTKQRGVEAELEKESGTK